MPDKLTKAMIDACLIVCTDGEKKIPCSQYNSAILELFLLFNTKEGYLSRSRKKLKYDEIKAEFDRKEYPEKCGEVTYILLAVLEKILSDTLSLQFCQIILKRLMNQYDFPESTQKAILLGVTLTQY